MIALPESPDAFKDATGTTSGRTTRSSRRGRSTHGNVEEWLADWSRFESLLSRPPPLASFAYSCDTADPAARGGAAAVRHADRAQGAGAARRGCRSGSSTSATCVRASRRWSSGSATRCELFQRGQRAAVRRAVEADHRVVEGHRRDDRRVGRRGEDAGAAAPVPRVARSRAFASGRSSCERKPYMRAARRARGHLRPHVRPAPADRAATRASPTSATTPTGRRTGSTTRPTTACASTRRSRRPSCPPSIASSSGGAGT